MANQRDKTKRLKAFGIPIVTCVKYERLAGIKPGAIPTKTQSIRASQIMVHVLNEYVSHVKLSNEDISLIVNEVKANESGKRLIR